MDIIENIPKLPKRPLHAHKGDFGRILIIAGSTGMSGAAALAGKAALRSGAGLVKIACPRGIIQTIAALEPCYTLTELDQDNQGRISADALNKIMVQVKANDITAIGPGLGISKDLRLIINELIRIKGLNLILDADALNNLARIKDWPQKNQSNMIITPHPGEMKTLWKNLCREPLPKDRKDQARALQKMTNATVVLKGHETIVINENKLYCNKTGNPGMASAGSGDVLTGIIAALKGQNLCCMHASVLGAYIHGLAGDYAAEDLGQISMTASDIINKLPDAFKTL